MVLWGQWRPGPSGTTLVLVIMGPSLLSLFVWTFKTGTFSLWSSRPLKPLEAAWATTPNGAHESKFFWYVEVPLHGLGPLPAALLAKWVINILRTVPQLCGYESWDDFFIKNVVARYFAKILLDAHVPTRYLIELFLEAHEDTTILCDGVSTHEQTWWVHRFCYVVAVMALFYRYAEICLAFFLQLSYHFPSESFSNINYTWVTWNIGDRPL